MPSIVERNGRLRALIRKAGLVRCATFGSKVAARRWAAEVERELEELKATGIMQPRGLTVAEVIDRHVREMYPVRPWARSKQADLDRVNRDLGSKNLTQISAFLLTEHFRERHANGAGRHVINNDDLRI
jgi:hypothetical protein